jgi:sugar phosphate isomerase/epimerase
MTTKCRSRRGFLKRSSSLALALALGSAGKLVAQEVEKTGMPIKNIGVQLYTLRSLLAQDFPGTLQAVADIGYTELEFAGYYERSPESITALLKQLGLTAPSSHLPVDVIRDKLDWALDTAQAMGHRYLVVPWLAPAQRKTLDQYKALAELLNRAGERCQARGIQLAYHNHDFEFQAIENVRPYDLLLESTQAQLLTMELDLFWIAKAGLDPLDYFAAYPNRFSLCHVKDMNTEGDMVDVGSGVLDFATILTAAKNVGVQHFFVEHDEPEKPLQSIKNSYGALSALRI